MRPMVNSHLPDVNTYLRRSSYGFATMAKTLHSKPGPKKGTPKPFRRPLDEGFPARLLSAMQRRGFVRPNGTTMNAELAREVKCERATIGQYLSEEKPKKSIDASLLLDLCDALAVTPYWLLRDEGTIEDVAKNKIPLEEQRRRTPTRKTSEDEANRQRATSAHHAA